MAGNSAKTNWPSYVSTATICVAVLAALMRFFVIDYSDRNHCKSLLNTGRWMDSTLKSWQPQGCMTTTYTSSQIHTCLPSRRIVFIGDSITRQLFYSMAKMADPKAPDGPRGEVDKHADASWRSETGLDFQFFWDPFLNSSNTQTVLSTPSTSLPTYTPAHPPQPALLVLGTGLWYLRHPSSGGVAGWEHRIDQVFKTISKSTYSPNNANDHPLLADEIIFLPVQLPVVSKLTPDRAEVLLPSEIDVMNSDLVARLAPSSSFLFHDSSPSKPTSSPRKRRPPPISLPQSFNAMLDPAESQDGLHYSEKIVKAQANVLWNLRCNDVLPKTFPIDKTCCRRYPGVGWLQGLIILLVVGFVPVWRLLKSRLSSSFNLNLLPKDESLVLTLTVFGLCVGLLFVADRTPLWDKENKSFSGWQFGLACAGTLVGGLLTGRRSEGGKDLGFLNREQTDEWKGWMQIIILIYHYLGASKVSGIYNPVRVLVAAYLFMTGYGHFTYYYKKAEFGVDRIAMVMVRLNLLPIVLAYVMNTDYISYYFSPLVSFWYLIIYATMYLGNRFNTFTGFLLPKLVLSAVFVTWIMSSPDILDSIFSTLSMVFNIQWSAREWAFRVNLDIWVVYLGMFTAWLYIKLKELGIPQKVWWPTAVKVSCATSVLGLVWFFYYELTRPTKFVYNASHPYVSFVPIVSFVILRNATPFLRSVSSRMFCFIGQISLETFILQFHLWLAADTKGLLVVLPPGLNWRLLNTALTTLIFIFVSEKVSRATGVMTEAFVGKPKKPTGLPAPVSSSIDPNANVQTDGPSAPSEPSSTIKAEDSVPLLPLHSSIDEPDKPLESEPSPAPSLFNRRPSWPRWMTRPPLPLPLPGVEASPAEKILTTLGPIKDRAVVRVLVALVVCWVLNLASPSVAS